MCLNSVGGLGNLLVFLHKQKHSINKNSEMDLGYFKRQYLWEGTKITPFKNNPKKNVLVITDCSLSMFDCKWASINMEQGSSELEYCCLEFYMRTLITLTRFSDMSWELVKKFKRLCDLLWPAVLQTTVNLYKRILSSASYHYVANREG